MTTKIVEGESLFPFDKVFFNDQVQCVIDNFLPRFRRKLKQFVLFHLCFVLLFLVEFFSFIYFLSFLVQSSLLAISLALIFLTFFSYFILRLYYKTKRTDTLIQFRDLYIQKSKKLISFRTGICEHHLALASACTKMAHTLEGVEKRFYSMPSWFNFLKPTIESLSFWLYLEDVFQLREYLLLHSIEEHIKLVKIEPCDLEVHVALANAYVLLSQLYIKFQQLQTSDEYRFVNEKFYELMKTKFRQTAERAIEEFQILNDFAPNDAWVHSQLAFSYHDLGMPEDEIKEYETINRLNPQDKDNLFKLGILYFQQGHNASGLTVYEELKGSNYKKAEQLIEHYGDFTPNVKY